LDIDDEIRTEKKKNISGHSARKEDVDGRKPMKLK